MSHCDPTTLALAALGEDIAADESAHLSGCEVCLTEVAELAALVALAREAPRELPEVPAGVWAGISAELGLAGGSHDDATPSGPAAAPAPPWPRAVDQTEAQAPRTAAAFPSAEGDARTEAKVIPLRPRWARLVAVGGIAAAVGAIVGGAVVWAALEPRGVAPSPPEQIVAQAVLNPLSDDVSQAGQAKVLDSPDGQVIRVDATALPPRNGFYEVWLIDAGVTKLVALGALPAGSVGTFTIPPGIDVADFPLVDISLEPLDGDPAHSKKSLMRGTLET